MLVFQCKHEHFSDWYQDTLFTADILDQRFPVKGFNVWKGYGTKIIENVMDILERLLDNNGHSKTYFPLLIPVTIFGKESKHLKGFEEQVFWVEKAGIRKLSRKLVVRPTSETAMYHMFSLWIRSHADLPIKVYQTVSVFRYETKSTKPLIRDREMWPFNEAHTVHTTLEEAEKQIEIGIKLYKELFRIIKLPYLLVKKPEWELFPGAISAYEFYTLMPDGRVVETGSVNNLGQSFAKVFDITFEKKDGTRDYVYQTCYGQSERLLAGVIASHGDDHGLVLPSSIAPTRIIIVPIGHKKNKEVLNYATRIKELLLNKGQTVQLDEREMTPGEKYYYWEKRGIPIRLEIGLRELKNKTVTIVQRHTLRKDEVPFENIDAKIDNTLKTFDQELFEKAKSHLKNSIQSITNLNAIKDAIQHGKSIFQIRFCREKECKKRIEEETNLEIIGYSISRNEIKYKCIICGKPTVESIFLARTY